LLFEPRPEIVHGSVGRGGMSRALIWSAA
jgi:hypothetical protein